MGMEPIYRREVPKGLVRAHDRSPVRYAPSSRHDFRMAREPGHSEPDADETAARDAEGPGGELGRLVEAERRLERMLDRRRREAKQIVEDARREAERTRAALARGLDEEVRSLEERVRRETERRIEEAREAGRARIRRYRSLTDEELEELIALVVDGVLEVPVPGDEA